ncbi:MAG: hypothetical protein B6241_11015 [Spirochaetaceae bacterium 4572_59]|nr:MAG: hypothetical protein B6241_11015 [Spirochaetaceae bacterium 4572_59]
MILKVWPYTQGCPYFSLDFEMFFSHLNCTINSWTVHQKSPDLWLKLFFIENKHGIREFTSNNPVTIL